jgi:ribulose-phosphate 3-epimerase
MPLVSASILAANMSSLGTEIAKLAQNGVDMVHFDVMDGHFVPNLTFGADLIKALRKQSDLVFDVHLMISNPMEYIKDFVAAGSDIITIHAEAVTHLDAAISRIQSLGCKAGVALNPSTNENILKYILNKIDIVLVMTVNPGFCGQKFLIDQAPKIARIRRMIDRINPRVILSVDGGINEQTASIATSSGANALVSGSYLYNAPDMQQAITLLREKR